MSIFNKIIVLIQVYFIIIEKSEINFEKGDVIELDERLKLIWNDLDWGILFF